MDTDFNVFSNQFKRLHCIFLFHKIVRGHWRAQVSRGFTVRVDTIYRRLYTLTYFRLVIHNFIRGTSFVRRKYLTKFWQTSKVRFNQSKSWALYSQPDNRLLSIKFWPHRLFRADLKPLDANKQKMNAHTRSCVIFAVMRWAMNKILVPSDLFSAYCRMNDSHLLIP